MSNSEVARLRREITLSYQAAMRVFDNPSITAPHAFITKKMEHISDCEEKLIPLVGAQQATRLTWEAMEAGGKDESL